MRGTYAVSVGAGAGVVGLVGGVADVSEGHGRNDYTIHYQLRSSLQQRLYVRLEAGGPVALIPWALLCVHPAPVPPPPAKISPTTWPPWEKPVKTSFDCGQRAA